MNTGQLDAEAGRVEMVGTHYAQLVPVPTPLMTFNVSYHCVTESACRHFNDKTVFIIPKGSEILVTFCEENRLTCLRVNNDESGFKPLNSGIGDVFLSADWIARTVMCNSPFRTFYTRSEPRLATSVYHYVNQKHKALVPMLNEAMQTLDKEGILVSTLQYGLNSHKDCGAEIISVSTP